MLKSHIFIAHVEEDADIALEIALSLEEGGYTTWCYEVDSVPGPSYLIQTARAIDQAEVFVLVISPHSVGSRQVTNEVVRAHESGKHFVPVLRNITHVEFQNRQPEWREAVGSATSVIIPQTAAKQVIPRIINGLNALGIQPKLKTDAIRIERIRKILDELQVRRTSGKAEEPQPLVKEPEQGSLAVQTPSAKTAKETKRRQKWIPITVIAGIIVVGIVLGAIFITRSQPPTTPPASDAKPAPSTDITFQSPPSPAPPVEPKVQLPVPATAGIFVDDFSDTHTLWQQRSEEAFDANYEKGEYSILVKKYNAAYWSWNQNAGRFEDFTLEMDVRLVDGPNQSDFGTVFRCQDLNSYYCFTISGDGSYLVIKKVAGIWTDLLTKTKSSFIKEGTSTNHLKVVCRGTKIELYVNGNYLTTITDNTFNSGYVGMIVSSIEPNSHVHFDNLKVSKLD